MLASSDGKLLILVCGILGAVTLISVVFLWNWLKGVEGKTEPPPRAEGPQTLADMASDAFAKKMLGCFLIALGIGVLTVLAAVFELIKRAMQ